MNEELESNSEAKELSERDERFVAMLQRLIHYAVRVLAVLMVIVIWFGVADVLYVLITRISAHPFYLIDISDILATFGAFMAVLIAFKFSSTSSAICVKTPFNSKLFWPRPTWPSCVKSSFSITRKPRPSTSMPRPQLSLPFQSVTGSLFCKNASPKNRRPPRPGMAKHLRPLFPA